MHPTRVDPKISAINVVLWLKSYAHIAEGEMKFSLLNLPSQFGDFDLLKLIKIPKWI